MKQTAIADKAAKAFGFLPRQMALWRTVAAFIDDGGTEIELMAVYRAIAGMRGGGLQEYASNGLDETATAHTNGSEGGRYDAALGRTEDAATLPPHDGEAIVALSKDHELNAEPSPKASGKGHSLPATTLAMRSVPPARPPSADVLAATAKAKQQAARSVFERELTHTGRQWGNIYYRELDSMKEDGDIAIAVKKHVGSLRGDDRHKTVRELMTPREFSQLINRVRKHAK